MQELQNHLLFMTNTFFPIDPEKENILPILHTQELGKKIYALQQKDILAHKLQLNASGNVFISFSFINIAALQEAVFEKMKTFLRIIAQVTGELVIIRRKENGWKMILSTNHGAEKTLKNLNISHQSIGNGELSINFFDEESELLMKRHHEITTQTTKIFKLIGLELTLAGEDENINNTARPTYISQEFTLLDFRNLKAEDELQWLSKNRFLSFEKRSVSPSSFKFIIHLLPEKKLSWQPSYAHQNEQDTKFAQISILNPNVLPSCLYRNMQSIVNCLTFITGISNWTASFSGSFFSETLHPNDPKYHHAKNSLNKFPHVFAPTERRYKNDIHLLITLTDIAALLEIVLHKLNLGKNYFSILLGREVTYLISNNYTYKAADQIKPHLFLNPEQINELQQDPAIKECFSLGNLVMEDKNTLGVTWFNEEQLFAIANEKIQRQCDLLQQTFGVEFNFSYPICDLENKDVFYIHDVLQSIKEGIPYHFNHKITYNAVAYVSDAKIPALTYCKMKLQILSLRDKGIIKLFDQNNIAWLDNNNNSVMSLKVQIRDENALQEYVQSLLIQSKNDKDEGKTDSKCCVM